MQCFCIQPKSGKCLGKHVYPHIRQAKQYRRPDKYASRQNEKENIGNGLRGFIFYKKAKQRKNFVEQSDNNACQHTGCQDI